MIKQYKINGFTLLEVLIALTILAIALGALIKAGSQYTENIAYLRDKTFAHWVALNILTEIQVGQRPLTSNQLEGSMKMADRDWFWAVKVLDTAEKQLRRLEITVSTKNSELLVLLVGFVVVGPTPLT